MPTQKPCKRRTFAVVCRWHPPGDACEPWQFIAVTIAQCTDAQDAANNACLYLIWDRQGMAEPWLVIEDKLDLSIPGDGTFDAEEFDETITFTGRVVSKRELG
ncbi:MAG: hypothetical protein A3H91_02230 [Gammaproteobacteria bacterium RIFCSPLOWO2_02_FULL_61_13]|nr:MAG: hypothetical protein A3H91_02230 [Gammaproteobacteria bacterium RIFCSPLOWO2_02_FULL_61_13]